jgi:hypothetical protein
MQERMMRPTKAILSVPALGLFRALMGWPVNCNTAFIKILRILKNKVQGAALSNIGSDGSHLTYVFISLSAVYPDPMAGC